MAASSGNGDNLGFTLNMASDTAYDFTCDPCGLDDKQMEAIGYCINCEDYLCQECYDAHLRPRPSRHHILLDQHKMPKDVSQRQSKDQQMIPKDTIKRQSKDMCTDPCTVHKHETLKYYCAEHDKLGCGVCKAQFHPSCDNVAYIPDIAEDVLKSKEYKDMTLRVKNLTKTAQQAINTKQNKTQTSNQQHSNAPEFFKQLKKDLNAAVDKLETLVMKDAGRIHDENQKSMKSVEDQYKQLLKEIGAFSSKYTILENKGQLCQIFFSMKRSQDEIAALEASLLQQQNQSHITEYMIKINDDLQRLILQPEKMATLQIINTPQTPSLQPTVQQNTPSSPLNPSAKPTVQQNTPPGPLNPSAKPTVQQNTPPGPLNPSAKPTVQQNTPPGPLNPSAKPTVQRNTQHSPLNPSSQPPPPAVPGVSVSESKEDKNTGTLHVADIGVRTKKMDTLEIIKNLQTPADHTQHEHSPKLGSEAKCKSKQHTKSAAKHVADIDVGVMRGHTCITGSVVLSGDKLVIVDYYNDTVKLINLQSNMVVSHLKCDSGLQDIAAVTNTQVAVTSRYSTTILFINVTNKLTLDHKLKVDGSCTGIACISSDKFVVTYYDPVKVKIINRTGEQLHTVVKMTWHSQLFTSPRYVALSPDQQTIYISDCDRHTVTSLDLNGQVKATYMDKELKWPHGLTVDRAGVLFVCGYWSNNIHQLTPDLHKIQILLQKSDGIECPESVSYNKEQNQLYIGMFKSDIIKVYQLH